jgi:hypothetical protein
MVIEYTRHARRRMKWRNISEAEVQSTLSEPEKRESSERNRINAYKHIEGRLLKVTYLPLGDRFWVITAMWKEG